MLIIPISDCHRRLRLLLERHLALVLLDEIFNIFN